MNKEFVPYGQALELKKLGFDEPCFAYYDEDIYLFTVREQDDVHDYWTPAPTYSQAFRWFREKYNLYSFVFKFNEGFGYETYKEGVTQTNDSFDTYEEAELACLIKLIEIVKQNDRNRRVE